MHLEECCKSLEKSKLYSLDLETTALSPLDGRIKGLGIATREGAWYFPFIGEGKMPFLETMAKLQPFFQNNGRRVGIQNALFELSWFKTNNIEIKIPIVDTMIAMWLLDENQTHNLRDMAKREFDMDIPTYKEADSLIGDLAGYNKLQTRATLELALLYEVRLKEEELWKPFVDLEMPLVPVLAEMELHGISVDRPALKEVKKRLETELASLKTKILKEAGYSFNIGSPQQLAHFLFEELKLPTEGVAKTQTGYSVAKKELKRLERKHPMIKQIQRHQLIETLWENFAVPLVERLQFQEDDKIHTHYGQTQMRTGRVSSSEPNLQQIPTTDEFNFRSCFVPSEGNVFIDADFATIELRMLAHRSRDKRLIETFLKDEDPHQDTGDLFGLKRKQGKTTNFCMVYGGGAGRLVDEFGVSYEKARNFISKYFEEHEGVRAYKEYMNQKLRTDGYVRMITGRKRRIAWEEGLSQEKKGQKERALFNAGFQGSAADVQKLALVKVDRMLKDEFSGAFPVLQVHDEILAECPENAAEQAAKRIKEVMENVVQLRVPLKVDISIGKNWAESKA